MKRTFPILLLSLLLAGALFACKPSGKQTANGTPKPEETPALAPTEAPSAPPTAEPTAAPTAIPTAAPAQTPAVDPNDGDYSDCIALAYPSWEINREPISGVHDIDMFMVRFMLPEGWKVVPFRPYENQIYLRGWYPEASTLNCLRWLVDENGEYVGAFGYDTYEEYEDVPPENYHEAVYAFLNGTGARIDYRGHYQIIENPWENVTALSLACYSGSSYLDAYIPGSPDIENPAILSYLDSRRVYFAMELKNSLPSETVRAIAESFCICDGNRLEFGNTRSVEFGGDAKIDELFEELHDIALIHGLDIVKDTVSVSRDSYYSNGPCAVFYDAEGKNGITAELDCAKNSLSVDYSDSTLWFEYPDDAQLISDSLSFEIDTMLGRFSSVTDPAIGETIASRIADSIVNTRQSGHPHCCTAAAAVQVRPIVMEDDHVKYLISGAFLPQDTRAYLTSINPDCAGGLYDGSDYPEYKGWLTFCYTADAELLSSGEWQCSQVWGLSGGGYPFSFEPIYTEPWFVENAWHAVISRAYENGVEPTSISDYDFSMDDERASVTFYDEKGNSATAVFVKKPNGLYSVSPNSFSFQYADSTEYPEPEKALEEAVIELKTVSHIDDAGTQVMQVDADIEAFFTDTLPYGHPARSRSAQLLTYRSTAMPSEWGDGPIELYIEIALNPVNKSAFYNAFSEALTFGSEITVPDFGPSYGYYDMFVLCLTADLVRQSGDDFDLLTQLTPAPFIPGVSRAEQYPNLYGDVSQVQIISVPSEIFREWVIEDAIRLAIERFERCFRYCRLDSIAYVGDEANAIVNAERDNYEIDPTLNMLIEVRFSYTYNDGLMPCEQRREAGFVFAKYFDFDRFDNYPWEYAGMTD